MNRKIWLTAILTAAVSMVTAQSESTVTNQTENGPLILNVDSCRSYALRNNNELKSADAKKQKAYYDRKAAFTKFFPRISATGIYMFTSKNIELMSEDDKNTLNNLGTNLTEKGTQMVTDEVTKYIVQHPEQMMDILNKVNEYKQKYGQQLQGVTNSLNGVGSHVVDAFATDTRNLGLISVMLTQPIYMGGKIKAYYNITKKLEILNESQTEQKEQEVIVEVDEAYWRIVSLAAKKKLAESYLATVDTLNRNVEKLIAAGLATKSDGLSVKVKLNEARVSIIQVENGIALSKMFLCQLCGLDLNTDIKLVDEGLDPMNFQSPMLENDVDVDAALDRRSEMRSLNIAKDIAEQKVKIARSEFLPTVALMGGYTTTYPSCFNGFEKKFGGMWNVGVMVNVPVLTCGERIYKVKAAKEEAKLSEYQYDEIKEKLTLQINQSKQKIQEANSRLIVARQSQAEAEENLRYANIGLKEGMIPVSNVLQAQTALLSAQSELLSAEIDVMLADVYMRKALGVLEK